MKLNRKWLLVIALLLSVAVATAGTLAYLTDADKDVNTMTLGKVEIVQNEQEWNDDKTALEEFTQDKPLLPYVGTLDWENTTEQGGDDAYRRFTMNNVVDKYVTVTNTGNTDAYVRTIIAVEMGEFATIEEFKYNIVGTSTNAEVGATFNFPGAWVWSDEYVAQIDGQNYMIMTATHKNPVKAKETTIPSLLQLYVNKDCDNEQLTMLDGNKNGKLDVLVLSQAVQAAGFEEMGAAAALDEAFEESNATNVAGWFTKLEVGSPGDKWPSNNPPASAQVRTVSKDEVVKNSEGTIVIDEDLTIDANIGFRDYFGKIPLDVAFQFEPSISAEEVESSEYRYWHADYVVYADKNIPGMALGLAGYYEAWCGLIEDRWVLMATGETIPANTEIRLVKELGTTVTYEEICSFGNDGTGFLCGAVALDGITPDNGETIEAKLPFGTTLTVELRLYKTTEKSAGLEAETGDYVTVGTYTHTFY